MGGGGGEVAQAVAQPAQVPAAGGGGARGGLALLVAVDAGVPRGAGRVTLRVAQVADASATLGLLLLLAGPQQFSLQVVQHREQCERVIITLLRQVHQPTGHQHRLVHGVHSLDELLHVVQDALFGEFGVVITCYLLQAVPVTTEKDF